MNQDFFNNFPALMEINAGRQRRGMLRVGGSAMSKPRQELTTLRKAHPLLHALGARLRLMWDDIVHEPVPEEMMDLLRRIDERERQRSASN